MKLYKRNHYLEKIRPFYDDELIKVITGIRRCGKSCLMASIVEELKERGVPKENIAYIDLEKHGYKSVKTTDQLEDAIEDAFNTGKIQEHSKSQDKIKEQQIQPIEQDFDPNASLKYLFIDEVQNVKYFETVLSAYIADGGFSIFITGFNSYLLSGELMTKLTGRYIEFEMFSLSFSEYLGMKHFLAKEIKDKRTEFEDYLRYGGFPQSLNYDDIDAKAHYIEGVVNQIIEKDIKARKKIRNFNMFERVMTYIINNYGATFSLSNLVHYFNTVEKIPVQRRTIATYIELLLSAKILYKCQRFDLKSRKSLRGEEKYYLADPSIYFARNADIRLNYGPSLENVLYLYLRSLGYKLAIGRIGKLECDFIARKHNNYAYVQVALSIADKTTEDREYRPFSKIADNYPKYLFTLDPLLQKREGIRHLNLLDFMENDMDLVFA